MPEISNYPQALKIVDKKIRDKNRRATIKDALDTLAAQSWLEYTSSQSYNRHHLTRNRNEVSITLPGCNPGAYRFIINEYPDENCIQVLDFGKHKDVY
ncbi:MAG: hypothetical protein WCJ58_07340 [bacterium]